jgi:hypothetical protein
MASVISIKYRNMAALCNAFNTCEEPTKLLSSMAYTTTKNTIKNIGKAMAARIYNGIYSS